MLSGAVLLAAMVPFRDGPPLLDGRAVDLAGKRVAVSNGRHDPLVDPTQTAELVAQLRGCGAEVQEFPHDGGHDVPAAVLPRIRDFLGVSG